MFFLTYIQIETQRNKKDIIISKMMLLKPNNQAIHVDFPASFRPIYAIVK
jgi:hypothetical protein